MTTNTTLLLLLLLLLLAVQTMVTLLQTATGLLPASSLNMSSPRHLSRKSLARRHDVTNDRSSDAAAVVDVVRPMLRSRLPTADGGAELSVQQQQQQLLLQLLPQCDRCYDHAYPLPTTKLNYKKTTTTTTTTTDINTAASSTSSLSSRIQRQQPSLA